MTHPSAPHLTRFLYCLLSLRPADDAEWSRFRGNKRYDYFQQRVKHGELLRTREPFGLQTSKNESQTQHY